MYQRKEGEVCVYCSETSTLAITIEWRYKVFYRVSAITLICAFACISQEISIADNLDENSCTTMSENLQPSEVWCLKLWQNLNS